MNVVVQCVAVLALRPVLGLPARDMVEEVAEQKQMRSFVGVIKDCAFTDFTLCLEEKAMRATENFASKKELSITDAISIVSTGPTRSARALEPLPVEPTMRQDMIEERIVGAVTDVLEHNVLQLRIPPDAIHSVRRSLEEGRKKKKKGFLPLLSILQLKFTALIPFFLSIIAFAAVKALLLGKLALLASALYLVKKLLGSKSHDSSSSYSGYESSSHGDESYGSSNYGSSWGRGTGAYEGQKMAYNSYAPHSVSN